MKKAVSDPAGHDMQMMINDPLERFYVKPLYAPPPHTFTRYIVMTRIDKQPSAGLVRSIITMMLVD